MTQRTIATHDCTYCPFPAPNIVQLCFIASTFPAYREPGLRVPPPRAGRALAGSGCSLLGTAGHVSVCPPPRGREWGGRGGERRGRGRGCCREGSCPASEAARELGSQQTAASQNGFRKRVQKPQEEDLDRSPGSQIGALGSSDVHFVLIPFYRMEINAYLLSLHVSLGSRCHLEQGDETKISPPRTH